MNRTLIRLLASAVAITIFVLCVSAIAANPWQHGAGIAKHDPRLTALAERERALQQRAKSVQRIVRERWKDYKHRLDARKRAIRDAHRAYEEKLKKARVAAAAAPPLVVGQSSAPVVQVVTLPPVSNSHSS